MSSQETRDGGGSLCVNVTCGFLPCSFHVASGASMASFVVTARVIASRSLSEPVNSTGTPTITLDRSGSIASRGGGAPSTGVSARCRGRTQRRRCRHRRTRRYSHQAPYAAVPRAAAASRMTVSQNAVTSPQATARRARVDPVRIAARCILGM